MQTFQVIFGLWPAFLGAVRFGITLSFALRCMSTLRKHVLGKTENLIIPLRIPAKMQSSAIDLQPHSEHTNKLADFTKYHIPPLKPNPD